VFHRGAGGGRSAGSFAIAAKKTLPPQPTVSRGRKKAAFSDDEPITDDDEEGARGGIEMKQNTNRTKQNKTQTEIRIKIH